eukprot:tig00000383_g24615.t1
MMHPPRTLQTEYLSLLDLQGATGGDVDSGLGFEHFGGRYLAEECTPLYDAEPASKGRSSGGSRAADDVARAYGTLVAADFEALLLEEVQIFSFPQRGIAFFASYASSGPVASLPLIKACAPQLGVALLAFPTSPATCPFELVGASVCPGLDVAHVTAIFSWAVDESALLERASAAGASYKYRSGVVLHGPPTVLRTDTLPLSHHWIVQNERPLVAGRGFGYLEGRWVEAPGSRFSFYVAGDQVVRVAKADGYQGGMAGRLDGSVRVFGGPAWRGTLSNWTSVAAAAYKDGVLFVVREVHSAASQRSFVFATSDSPRPRLVKEKRLHRSNERATSSQLLRIRGVDGPSFDAESVAVSIVLDNWVANVVGAYTVEDYGALDAFGDGFGVFNFSGPVPELPVVLFAVSEPATLISLHTYPGTFGSPTHCVGNFKHCVGISSIASEMKHCSKSPRSFKQCAKFHETASLDALEV